MNYSILVVDDHWETREVLVSILGTQDEYSVISAENGKDALRKLKARHFDLVITDISMPIMDGLELLDHLVKELPELPVITFTGFGDLFSIKALERGAEDCIFKPFDARDLKLRVSKALKYSRIKKYQELLAQKNEQLHQAADLDQLTQLYNRRILLDILHREINRANRYRWELSCVLVDLDNFKAINTTYGYLQGDAILREFAALLKHNTREVDFHFRFAGEEFLLLMPQTDHQGAAAVLERVQQLSSTLQVLSLGQIEPIKDLKLQITIGISTYPDPRVHTEMDLVTLADESLRSSKQEKATALEPV